MRTCCKEVQAECEFHDWVPTWSPAGCHAYCADCGLQQFWTPWVEWADKAFAPTS